MAFLKQKSSFYYTVPKLDGKFRYIERVALVQSNMERIFQFTYFPSRACKFPATDGIFHSPN
jgi:hypothetical protein